MKKLITQISVSLMIGGLLFSCQETPNAIGAIETELVSTDDCTLEETSDDLVMVSSNVYPGSFTKEQMDSVEHALLAKTRSSGHDGILKHQNSIPWGYDDMKAFAVWVKTDSRSHAGTNGEIWIGFRTLSATAYRLPPYYTNPYEKIMIAHLDIPHFDDNEEGAYIRYNFYYKENERTIDKIKGLIIQNNSTDGWYCNFIRVYEYNKNQTYRYNQFNFYTWVDRNDGHNYSAERTPSTAIANQNWLMYD